MIGGWGAREGLWSAAVARPTLPSTPSNHRAENRRGCGAVPEGCFEIDKPLKCELWDGRAAMLRCGLMADAGRVDFF